MSGPEGGAAVATPSLIVDPSTLWVIPTDGQSYVVPNNLSTLVLDPAGALATMTVTMPAAPADRQRLCIAASSFGITLLTMNPNSGQSLRGALTALAAQGFAVWTYRSSNATWYRVG